MDTKQQMDERFDRYLSGDMTGEERMQFEEQIAGDVELRREVDLHQRIVSSIKAKNAKHLLQNRENRIKKQRRRKTFTISLSSFAAAACVLLAIVNINTISSLKSAGELYYSEFSASAARGGNTIDSLLHSAYLNIGNTEYVVAIDNLDAAIELLDKEQFNTSTEEGLYFQQMAFAKRDEAEWLKAITYMKQGKAGKAKKLLRKISNSDSRYNSKAQEILD